MSIWFLAVIGLVAIVLFWRTKNNSGRKLIRRGVLLILGLIVSFPFILYFLLEGNPKLDIFAERLSFNGTETLYYKYGDEIFYMNQGNITQDRRYLEDVDQDSFELINEVWARDNNYVYWRYQKTDFSPESFSIRGCYISDGNSIYKHNRGQPITISDDADNFTLIDHPLFNEYNPTCMGKDSQHVYYWFEVLPDADPATFRVLNKDWSIDQDHVFVNDNLVANLSPAGLVSAGDALFAKNSVTVFAAQSEAPYYIDLNADPQTFEYGTGNDGKFYWQGSDKDFFYTRNGEKKAR